MRRTNKPLQVPLFKRDEAVRQLLIADAGLIAAGFGTDTVMVDRHDVRRTVWRREVERRWEPLKAVGNIVIGAGFEDTQALWTSDGSVCWRVDATAGVKLSSGVVFRSDEGLRVIDPATAQLRATNSTSAEWLQECGRVCLFRPTGQQDELGAFDPEANAVLWQRPLEQEMDDARTAPLLHEFVGPHPYSRVMWAGNENFIVRRVGEPKGASLFLCDTHTGAIQWQANPRLDTYAVTVVDSRVVVPKWKGISVLDLATGTLIADLAPPEMAAGTHPRPAVAFRGRVAVPYQTGHIAVYDVASAARVQVLQTKHPFNRAIEADGRLAIGTSDGSLVVYDDTIWAFD